MDVYFFDASALVKRYVQEAGTAWVQAIADTRAGNHTYITRFRQDMAVEYRVIEITTFLLDTAANLAESHALRAYDAVQLAAVSALHAQRNAASLPALTMLSADQDLNVAASALGIAVDDPNAHP